MADCWHLRGQNPTKATMTTMKDQVHCRHETQHHASNCVTTLVMDTNLSFLRVTYICQVLIQRLPSSGANQSLLLEVTLPLSDIGVEVLVCGVGLEPIIVPIHEVELQSDILSGVVKIGVRPSLLIEGTSLILGNDLAGGKVRNCRSLYNLPTGKSWWN